MVRMPALTSDVSHDTVLSRAQWQPLLDAHVERADALTASRRERASRGETHAVDDFLYDYYSLRPGDLRRWHPGPGIGLKDDDHHVDQRFYRTERGVTGLDVGAFVAKRGPAVEHILRLLTATASRPARLGCFGMHEWAMVYQAPDAERRHALPLRLGRAGTDAVVESHPLECTHFDAFRFFTPEAAPRNALALTRDSQTAHDQPGCLHATMDLLKWSLKLGPLVPGAALLDAFELARDVRQVDMRASPYDVSDYGLEPIAVETPDGKREYAARQREFAARAAPMREHLMALCEAALASGRH